MRIQIPDEALAQLRSLLEHDTQVQWAVGDFICDFWEETLKYIRPEEVREKHAELITQFADGTGASRTTLRDREKMSLQFTVRERERFPMYTFHQFRALRSAGEDWEEWAEWGLVNGFNGAPASTRVLRAAIKGEQDPYDVLHKQLDDIEKKARKLMDAEDSPDSVKRGLTLIPTIITDVKESL
ncbi:MAG: hypothetical protein ACYSW8_25125 [Planctomycetota bacterium]|jgi:hypothetical protein